MVSANTMSFKIDWADLDQSVASNFFNYCENLKRKKGVNSFNLAINEVLIPFNGFEHAEPYYLEFKTAADYTFFILRFS